MNSKSQVKAALQKFIIDQQDTKIDLQTKKLEEQSVQIEKLIKDFENLQISVYQLIGGLFNKKKQGSTLDHHISMLYSEDEDEDQRKETVDSPDGWGIWPTTRQGDMTEQKCAALEERVRELEKCCSEKDKKLAEVEGSVFETKFALKELGAMLFDQDEQATSWREFRDLFWHDDAEPCTRPDTSKWTHYPTTKQGNDLEKRLAALEMVSVDKLDKKNTMILEEGYHSSSKKKRNSSYLCGND